MQHRYIQRIAKLCLISGVAASSLFACFDPDALDGARPGPDGCEPGYVLIDEVCRTSRCGDGVVAGAEACDGADLNGQTCESLGRGVGVLLCGAGCVLDFDGCQDAPAGRGECGDNTRDPGEECDGDDVNEQTCPDGSSRRCSTGCKLLDCAIEPENNMNMEPPETCHDRVKNQDELSPDCGGVCDPCGSISLGRGYSCGLFAEGGACWGDSTNGTVWEVGTISFEPTKNDLLGTALAVEAGDAHACALLADRTALCWGANGWGQLGIGQSDEPTNPVLVPTKVQTDRSIDQLACGALHCCALFDEGEMACWGDNQSGQLGGGTTDDSPAPRDVINTSSSVVSIAAGGSVTCVITTDGGLQCWGNNQFGQLGNGATSPPFITAPQTVSAVTDVTSISVGASHVCAVTAGDLYCWGSNDTGQLGYDSAPVVSEPRVVPNLPPVKAVSAGVSHTCALLVSGEVMCWGSNNAGQLGDGSDIDRSAPASVSMLESVREVEVGMDHSCARTSEATIVCWGGNSSGQIGDGSSEATSTPVHVSQRGL